MEITFKRYGDFYEFMSEDIERVRAVADILGRTVSRTRTPGVVTVGVPYHGIDDVGSVLVRHGYTVVFDG